MELQELLRRPRPRATRPRDRTLPRRAVYQDPSAGRRPQTPPDDHADPPVLKCLLADLAVKRPGPGRPRTRPEAVLGDKAYSGRGNRTLLRSKRITAVIPQRADEIGHRQRRGSAGGRPPKFDKVTYKNRNVVERSFNDHKQWRGIATRYDKHAAIYRGGVVLRAIALWLHA